MVIQLGCCFNDLRSSYPKGTVILTKTNMAAIQLDVNHKYTTLRARLINDLIKQLSRLDGAMA